MDVPQLRSVRLHVSVAKIKSGLICYYDVIYLSLQKKWDFWELDEEMYRRSACSGRSERFLLLGRRHNYLKVFSKTILPNEHVCSVLYATLEFLCSILSAIYAASSFCYPVRYYKTGVNGVVHFAELVNTYICVRKIIILSSCLKHCTVLRS